MNSRVDERWRWRTIESPIGQFVIHADRNGTLRTAWFDDLNVGDAPPEDEDQSIAPDLVNRLMAYFDGKAVDFDDTPTPEGPPFFVRCWRACRRIQPGTTISYADLAVRAGGDRRASRAAGQAMRRNPMPVIVPCHRVISATGGLGGYAGCDDPIGPSLRRKNQLLHLERQSADAGFPAAPLFRA